MIKILVISISGEDCYTNDYDGDTYMGIINRDIQNIFPFDDFKLCLNNIIIPLYKKLNELIELNTNSIELNIIKSNNNNNIKEHLIMFNKNNEIIYIKQIVEQSWFANEPQFIYNILPNIIPLKIIYFKKKIFILTIYKELYLFDIDYPEEIIKYNNIENINNIFSNTGVYNIIIITDNNNNIFQIEFDFSIKHNLILKNIKDINNILDIHILTIENVKYYIIKYLNNYIEIYDKNNINIINYENIKEIIFNYEYLFLITVDNEIISFTKYYQSIFSKYNFIKIILIKLDNYDQIIGILNNNDIIIISICDYNHIEINIINNNILQNIIEIIKLSYYYVLINDIGDVMIIDFYDKNNYSDFRITKDIIVYTETYNIKKYDITISSSEIEEKKLHLILGKNITNIINNNDILCAISNDNIGYIWSSDPQFTVKIINNIKDIIINTLCIVIITYDLNIIIHSITNNSYIHDYINKLEKIHKKLCSYQIKKIIGLTNSIIVITVDNKVIQFGVNLKYEKDNKIKLSSRIYNDEITQIFTC